MINLVESALGKALILQECKAMIEGSKHLEGYLNCISPNGEVQKDARGHEDGTKLLEGLHILVTRKTSW